MPSIDRDGVTLHYETRGSGPALLLTHGFSATAQMWSDQLAAFSDDHTVITWDLRGHGHSDAPKQDALYSEALAVEDMAAILDHHGFETAVVGGLSLGGYLSLAFHATYPERVTGLLIIDCGPGYRRDDARAAWNETAHARALAIERDGAAALAEASPEQATAEHRDIEGLAYAARNLLTQHSARVIDSLPSIRVPSLVIAGAQDTPFLAATDYMAAKIPGASKLIIENAGHAVNLDQPQAFNAGVRRFLAANGL